MSKKKCKSKPTRLQKCKGVISNFQQRSPKWKLFVLGTVAVIVIIIVLIVVFWPSNEATTARNGDTVTVSYIGTYDNGSVFDSAGINGSDPMLFTIGDSGMIPGFEKGLIGMSVNETRHIHVAPQDGYGPSEFKEDINAFPTDVAVGQYYSHTLDSGIYVEARVTAINGSIVTLQNLNHMAGQNLNFEITLIELIKASQTSSNSSS